MYSFAVPMRRQRIVQQHISYLDFNVGIVGRFMSSYERETLLCVFSMIQTSATATLHR